MRQYGRRPTPHRNSASRITGFWLAFLCNYVGTDRPYGPTGTLILGLLFLPRSRAGVILVLSDDWLPGWEAANLAEVWKEAVW